MKIQTENRAPVRRVSESPSIMEGFDDPRIDLQDRIRMAKHGGAIAEAQAVTRGPVANPIPASVPSPQTKIQATTSLTGRDDLAARVTNNALGPEWVRQDFPSHHISYDGQDIFVRPMGILDLSRVSAASKNENFTTYIDALNNCISMDIRDLTPGDFTFFLYWLRMNTFPTAPMVVKWTSKYGNSCEYRVSQSNLEIEELEMSREEYDSWLGRGICMPTVRDMELVTDKDIDPSDAWRVELAQYVHTTVTNPKQYLSSKLEKLEELGAQGFLAIQEFAKKISHGVVERVKVRDTKFEAMNAIAYLRSTADELESSAKQLIAGGFEKGQEVPLLALATHAEKMREEAAEIEAKINDGIIVNPDEEVIALSISAMTFFPTL